MPTALIADPICKQHDPGWNHPETPDRFSAVWQTFQNAGLTDLTLPLTGRPADEETLALCHDPAYIEQVHTETQSGVTQLSTGDTAVSLRSYEVAQYAVGAVLRAVEAVMNSEARNAFCLVRPPGHHATAQRGMGFCIFNNVAVAARYAQKKYGIDRVLIVDWDVHHGNGTQDIFYNDPSVFYFSTHQSPLYPFTGWPEETGEGDAKGTTMNRAFPPESGRAELFTAYEKDLAEAMEQFRPDLILLSAGFDSHRNDPLGHFTLEDNDFRDLTRLMMEMAATYCNHRLISVLEGGYNLHALASAAATHLDELVHGCRA